MDALTSGKYDPHKVALILFQTGGGCRASNYIPLLRKALERGGFRSATMEAVIAAYEKTLALKS